jgi:preprotein translocase subunit SecA
MQHTLEYRRTALPHPPDVTKGLDAVVDRLVGSYKRRGSILKALMTQAEEIDRCGKNWDDLSDGRLKEALRDYQALFRRNTHIKREALNEAMAGIRTVCERTTGLRPYPVQLAGALTLHKGHLAEMATGEGKTLTAAMAGVLAGWTRRPTHIITVNDYLAQRDTQLFRLLYQFCGVSCGFVLASSEQPQRKEGYAKDITYTTSKEIVADFLRDRLRIGNLHNASRRELRNLLDPRGNYSRGMVMRGLHTAIIDEADSVLIDEAVTPVIISQAHENATLTRACGIAADVAARLEKETHYTCDPRYKEIALNPAGKDMIETHCSSLVGLWKSPSRRRELVEQALNAREYFVKDKQYVVVDGKVVIIDELTGRQMPQRTWREGLHQAIEAKEDLPLSDPSETLSRISFQRFFRLFKNISGMTGTAREAAGEFWHIYQLPVVTIPTNQPCIRNERPDMIFPTEDMKWDAAVQEIIVCHYSQRPVLVGTRNVKASEQLARRLEHAELDFNLLNAVRHEEEARVIAEAGKRGRITIATNMAGRGTDIILGQGVAEQGGLHVIATERHESRRIDRQLYGRSGRQGDPGSSQMMTSLEDELFQRYLPRHTREQLRDALHSASRAGYNLCSSCLDQAQTRAEKQAFKQRLSVLKTDQWLEDSLGFAGLDSEGR